MIRLKYRHVIATLLFMAALVYAVDSGRQKGPIYKTRAFTVALNQAYVHCNHKEQTVKITLTMNGKTDSPITLRRIYVSFDNGERVNLRIPEFTFSIDSGDFVIEKQIDVVGKFFDESWHHQVPHISILMRYEGDSFTIKNSAPGW